MELYFLRSREGVMEHGSLKIVKALLRTSAEVCKTLKLKLYSSIL